MEGWGWGVDLRNPLQGTAKKKVENPQLKTELIGKKPEKRKRKTIRRKGKLDYSRYGKWRKNQTGRIGRMTDTSTAKITSRISRKKEFALAAGRGKEGGETRQKLQKRKNNRVAV